MEPDDVRLQDARAWRAPAEALWGDVMFHSQQAAEKALKAFLAWQDVPFRKTHNLEELGRQCAALDPTLKAIADEAGPLTEYAWRFRYPGDATEPERAEAEDALEAARRVYNAVLHRLPPAAQSR